jgi:mono/diheme cytochrome c family protein
MANKRHIEILKKMNLLHRPDIIRLYLFRPSLLICHFSLVILIFLSSCSRNNPDSPGVEYMPDMYRSPSYEDNSINPLFADSMTDRQPVKGTVPVGFTPDPFPNTPEGWTNASTYLKDPFPATEDIQNQGMQLFNIYCIHCHGKEGMGDGTVAQKLPGPPPPYSGPQLRNITEGEMFQTLEYGKNLMGSHASQLTVDQRWKIIRYVQVLQKKGQKDTANTTASADTTKIRK